MNSVGNILRERREKEGRALADIATELCVTQSYLRAIEENDIRGIPGLFFYKSFAKQYAAVLGIDDELIRPALDAIAEPESPQPRPEIRVPDRLVQASNRHHIPDVSMGWSVIGLVVVSLGCSGFYTWWKRIPERVTIAAPTTAAPTTAAPTKAAPTTATPITAVPTAAAPTTAAPILQTAPVMVVTAAASQPDERPEATTPIANEEMGGVVLKLSATERTWLSISSGGKEIFAGTLQASESKTLTGLERATMKVGNAGGIEVRWNGKIIGPLGTRGQVLTINITPQDFEIVPPKQVL